MLTDEIKQAEKDIDRLQGEVRDADRALVSAQEKFEGKDLTQVKQDDPEFVALSEAGKARDGIKDQLLNAVIALKAFDPDAGEAVPGTPIIGKKGQPEPFNLKGRVEGIVSSDEFKSAMGAYASGTQAGAIGRKELGTVAATEAEVKTLITRGVGGVDFLVQPDRLPLVDESPYKEYTILDLVTIGSTDANAIEYPAFLGRTGNAAIITDPADGTTASANLKPDIGLTFDQRTGRVRTLAAGIPVFRNTLEDNTSYLRTLIDQQLGIALRDLLQTQILSGTGVGENFTGILNTSGIVNHPVGATDSDVDALHRAITQLRLTGDAPNGIVLHPQDFEGIRLSQADGVGYYYGPPYAKGPTTIWGLPVVDSIAVPQGTAVVANWSYIHLLIRKGVTLLSSDSHSDFFMRNLIQFLAELRAALLVTRPAAIAKVTGLGV